MENAVKDTIGRSLNISGCKYGEYTVVRYIEKPSCTSCQLKLGEWKMLRRRWDKKYRNKNIVLAFIVETPKIEKTISLLKMNGFDKNSIVEKDMDFFKINNINPILGKDIVFLLNSKRQIILIGNPCENESLQEFYEQIFENRNLESI